MAFVIGIDSGGTHIVSQAIALNGKSLVKCEADGCGNILIDYSGTLERITNLITKIGEKCSLASCRVIVIGIAGFGTSNRTEELKKQLVARFRLTVVLMTDATLGLWNVLAGKDGALALTGTGSAVFAKVDRTVDRIGGWGYLIGDEGSAYDIARRSIKFITTMIDQQVDSEFVKLYLQFAQVANIQELISQVYSSTRKEIASLAMITANLSDVNDDAKKIITEAATSLAEQVNAMLARHDALSLVGESGSVLLKNKYYKNVFEQAVSCKFPEVSFVQPQHNNSYGGYYWYKRNEGLS